MEAVRILLDFPRKEFEAFAILKDGYRFGKAGEGGSSGWSGISTEGSGSGSGSPGGSIADPDLQDRPPPYHCSFCDKSFARLSYLKKHEQVRELVHH